VTAKFPYGLGEAYFDPELAELVAIGWEILVVPRSTHGVTSSWYAPRGWHVRPARLVSPRICIQGAKRLAKAPRRACAAVAVLRRAPSHLARNLAVVPKAMWLADLAEQWEADHIHAHWAGTTATMAMIAAQTSNLSWSFTAHRWDIADDNLLGPKVRSASFVRTISEEGLRSLAPQVEESDRSKIRVVHMGVAIPDPVSSQRTDLSGSNAFTMLCAGHLNEGKGHEYLFEAIAALKMAGVDDVLLLVAGDGPLMGWLRRKAESLGIVDQVRFLGHLAHDCLLSLYESGAVDLAVLPSSFEGIPVTLMEAMSYGVPVLATTVGGIPELCSEDCGVLIPPEDHQALAAAIGSLVQDREKMQYLGSRGRARVIEEFSIVSSVQQLSSMMAAAVSARGNK
jgi:colanic acid/amylovoran biosynthesis glycosyltransferase